jgi:thioredoxin 1
MAVENLNQESLTQKLDTAEGVLLIDFWAPWCAPCRAFGPVYEKVSKAHPDITFGKVNTEAEPALGASFGIRSIPTLMFFREGIMLFQQAGMLPEAALSDLIKQVRALDMDDVRAKIADEEKKHDHSKHDHHAHA